MFRFGAGWASDLPLNRPHVPGKRLVESCFLEGDSPSPAASQLSSAAPCAGLEGISTSLSKRYRKGLELTGFSNLNALGPKQ